MKFCLIFQLVVRVTVNALSLKHASIENVKIHASMSAVEQMPNVLFRIIGHLAFVRLTTGAIPMNSAEDLSGLGTLIAHQHWNVRMKSVLTPASAQGMPIAKPEITEEYVLVSLVILEIHMA